MVETREERFTRIYAEAYDASTAQAKRRKVDREDAVQNAAMYAWRKWDEISAMSDAELVEWFVYQTQIRTRMMRRSEVAEKRGGGRVCQLPMDCEDSRPSGFGECVVADLLDAIEPVHASMAKMRMDGYRWYEVGERLGLTERQVITQRTILQGALAQ